MKTDRELTRLAFKAAFNGADINHDQDMLKRWSPLKDDGDALRLAVKLGFSVVRETIKVPIVGIVDSLYGNQLTAFRWAWEPIGDDALAATRRAIVRAAAAIGEAMQ